MHQTPNLPGTSPVTDNPNPEGSQGMDTLGPSTGGGPGGEAGAERSQSASGGSSGARTFRCADVGNGDCRWEVTGNSEDELMPKIEQHGREAHGMHNFDGATRNKIRDAIRQRRAA